MPATTTMRDGKYRVVEQNGNLVLNKAGTPVDGGGHNIEKHAKAQAAAINIPKGKRK